LFRFLDIEVVLRAVVLVHVLVQIVRRVRKDVVVRDRNLVLVVRRTQCNQKSLCTLLKKKKRGKNHKATHRNISSLHFFSLLCFSISSFFVVVVVIIIIIVI